MKDTHVTIYDVAARAGVSASTASRTLAGLKVGKANREAVEKAAAEMGYVPNEAARSLRVVRTMTVGMVFNELTSALGMELLGGLSEALDTLGYSLFVSTAQGDPQRYDQLVRRFLERRVDALVCVHGRGEAPALARHLAARIPALSVISSGGDYARLPLVLDSIVTAARTCFRTLKAGGHRKVAIVVSHPPTHMSSDLFAAARAEGVETVEVLRSASGLDVHALLAARLEPNAPTAIITAQADALRLADALKSAGVSQADFAVVALRDRSSTPPEAMGSIPLIHFDPAKVGAEAARLLKHWLDHGEAPPAMTRIDTGTFRPGR